VNLRNAVKSLDDIASPNGSFSIIAMDQRSSLRHMFTAVGRAGTDEELRQAKVDVARVLTPVASGLLSDPTFGVPAIGAADALAPTCGLLVASEPPERRTYHGEPRTHRDPALDARWVLEQGGDALKFIVQLRGDRPKPAPGEPDLVAECVAVCTELIRDCRGQGVPVVIGNLEYPGSPEACSRLASVLKRPWAVLSAGVPFDQFKHAVRIAFDEGGAAGFIAGRSVWREAVELDGGARQQFLTDVAKPRLERLTAVADQYARPWR